MKIKTFLGYALVAAIAVAGTTDAYAQKKSSSRKTTSSKTSTSRAKTSTGGALTAAKLDNTSYLAIANSGQKDICFFNWINLEPGFNAVWNCIENKAEMTWKLSGNTLTLGKNQAFVVSSTNNGKTFTGKMSGTAPCTFYNITPSNGGFNPKEVEKNLLAGNYTALLGYQERRGKLMMGFPVTVKFTADDEDPGCGTFKVTGSNAMMAGLGALKFEYEFEEDKLTNTQTQDGTGETPYADNYSNYFRLDLGPSKVGALYLYLIKQ